MFFINLYFQDITSKKWNVTYAGRCPEKKGQCSGSGAGERELYSVHVRWERMEGTVHKVPHSPSCIHREFEQVKDLLHSSPLR
jgi:hypothetical protein